MRFDSAQGMAGASLMARPRAIFCIWDGEVFRPNKSFKATLEREFEVGSVYPLTVVEEQSSASRGHYFAALKEGFMNLSEANAARFPSVEHLRHWALIQCGYAHEVDYPALNPKQARQIALELRKLAPYAVIVPGEHVVKVFTAESQSPSSMKKERFNQSKNDVLDLVSSMARTTRPQLEREGRKHGR